MICGECKTLIFQEYTEYKNFDNYAINEIDDINLINTDGDHTKYYYYNQNEQKKWVFTENERSKAIDYDIFRRIVSHPAFVGITKDSFFFPFKLSFHNNMYLLNINSSQFGGLFYTQILNQGTLLKPVDILKWIIETIFPIKYLHDNNIYYHNLSANNLLLDQHHRICLPPSNFPFNLYVTQVEYNLPTDESYYQKRGKYIRTKEFPKLNKEMIEIEIRGIFEFWYELCTKKKFIEEDYNFDLIENSYGSRWRSLIENSLTKELVVLTWHDLNSTKYYIYLTHRTHS